jgi:hypothetical protein
MKNYFLLLMHIIFFETPTFAQLPSIENCYEDSRYLSIANGIAEALACKTDNYALGLPVFTQRFNLTILRSRQPNWTLPIILRHVENTAKIYSACKVGIGKINIVTANLPEPVNSGQTLDNYGSNSLGLKLMSDYRKNLPSDSGLLLVLIDGKLDANDHGYAYLEDRLAFFSFVGEKKRIDSGDTKPFGVGPWEPYDIVAHEIGHILIDSEYSPNERLGHIETPPEIGNLMDSNGFRANDKLNESQCERIRKNSHVSGAIN